MPRKPRPDDLMRHVGLRLLALRQFLGVEQIAFANAIGVQPNALSNYERGDRFPDPVAMIRMHMRFKWPLDFLYVGSLKGFDFDEQQQLIAICAELGAAIGAPTPEWPMAVEAAPGLRGMRQPGQVPRRRRPHGTLHEPTKPLS
jgi:transcriptional regulator with XRE-family HTH domain